MAAGQAGQGNTLGVVLVGTNPQPLQLELGGINVVHRAEQLLQSVGLDVLTVQSLDELDRIEDVLLVHDPLQVLVTADQVRTLLQVISGGAVSAAALSITITDTVKTIDNQGRLTGEVDRDQVREITGPVAMWVDRVPNVAHATSMADLVPALAGELLQVAVPGPLVRADSPSNIRMARALLSPLSAA